MFRQSQYIIKSNLRVQVADFLRNIHQGVNLHTNIALQSLTWKKVVNLLDFVFVFVFDFVFVFV